MTFKLSLVFSFPLIENVTNRGVCLAQLLGRGILDRGLLSLSPTLDVEIS